MDGCNLYHNYGYQLKHYFASGLSKIMDIRNVHSIDYPGCMSDEEAWMFDAEELRKDFEIVGEDMRKALDSYERQYTR